MTLDPAQGKDRDAATTPAPEDPRKPSAPTEITKPGWKFLARKAATEFLEDQCPDLAAALTYYSVLAFFPAAIAVLSLLGVVGQAGDSLDAARQVLAPLISDEVLDQVMGILEGFATSGGAGIALVTGLLTALWSASAYVVAFGRAMNRIYEVGEGRPVWKLRPQMILLTLVVVLLVGSILLMLVLSGPLAESIGSTIGLGEQTVWLWGIAKWPVMLLMVVLVVALLYYFTPNIKQPKFRWISVGAVIAILIAVAGVTGFSFHVANFGNYDATYGSVAGVIIALLLLWLVNNALLLGAEVDAELERVRQLEGGIAAEEEIQLPARDTTLLHKLAERNERDRELARDIRLASGVQIEDELQPPGHRNPPQDSPADDLSGGRMLTTMSAAIVGYVVGVLTKRK